MSRKYQAPPSRLSAAYRALYRCQESRNKNYLTYLQAENILLTAPGFTFENGGTASSLLQELEREHFINLDPIAERVSVLNWDKIGHAQSRPSRTEQTETTVDGMAADTFKETMRHLEATGDVPSRLSRHPYFVARAKERWQGVDSWMNPKIPSKK